MAFIGNTSTTQSFAPAIDYFNGNGSTTAFTLSRPVASVAQVQVVVNNVAQNPSSAYTVSGNTITFTSAPSAGTSNIYVYYTSPITQVVQPSTGTVGKTQLDVYGGTGTGAMTVPAGTTAQRPSNPVAGDTRWNTTLGQQEIWNGFVWQSVANQSYLASYLIVAGGGGGGISYGGGGGAGGLLSSTTTVISGTAYTITIGAGGAGSTVPYGATGSNSSALGLTASGGGGGGNGPSGPGAMGAGQPGGSGGGGHGQDSAGSAGGAGTSGQGFAGGTNTGGAPYGTGGGGGAGAVGGAGGSLGSGAGGAGVSNSTSGSAVIYAGGGGGGAPGSGGPGAGGVGGGGGGGAASTVGTAGTANTGGGGGGGGSTANGGAGGSGVVIISYVNPTQRATGGTVSNYGSGLTLTWVHTFTTSSTFSA